MKPVVIYTDLDGTLLDHHTYSHAAADPMLAELAQRGIPVVPCTSKTRAELLPLRLALHNRHPFIVENGAAVLIPHGYFEQPPEDAGDCDGYLSHSLVAPRRHWLQLIERLPDDQRRLFRTFSSMPTRQIAELTGLDEDSAARAAEREFGEPLQWLGEDAQREPVYEALRALGARVLEGGRFVHVSGNCDKGLALNWLNDVYAANLGERPVSIAIGDGNNDIAMLEAADHALIVRSPAHPPPTLNRQNGVSISHALGPQGWAEGVRELLQQLDS
jgi:mannosyl-3-phosphoglycerate phosphatase family protein